MNINLTRDGDSHVVGAQAHVGGVDVPGRGGDHSVVRSLQERSLRVDHLLRDGGVEDSLDRKVLDWQSLDLRDGGVVDSLDRKSLLLEGLLDDREGLLVSVQK